MHSDHSQRAKEYAYSNEDEAILPSQVGSCVKFEKHQINCEAAEAPK